MSGWRKLLGLALSVGAVSALSMWAPDVSVPAGVGAIVGLYGAFVAGNYGEHRARALP